ncbi:MAG: hypothetical protein ACTHOR_17795 [Devosia sp.]
MAGVPEPSDVSGNTRAATLLGVRALNEIVQAIKNVLPSWGSTASTASGGAATLPANPVGFVEVTINGATKLVPYYDP